MRLTEWPRMPFLNEEVKEWIALELESLGVEDLAVYALEAGTEGDERRVMVATEIGLLDHRYAPFGSSARYRLAMLMYPGRSCAASSCGPTRSASGRVSTARDGRSASTIRTSRPPPSRTTSARPLCDLARVCAVMAEPFGVPAGRVSSDVPGVIPGGPRPLPPAGEGPAGPTDGTEPKVEAPTDGKDEPAVGETPSTAEAAKPDEAVLATAVPIGEGEEILQLSDEEREAIPTRSDDQS